MPRESVEHKSLRESLTAARFGAVFVDSDEVSTVFATALSSPAPPARALSGGPSDWAYALFAPTASPRAQGGVPAYVAREIDFVLDALVSLKVLDARALYFDALDATLSDPVRPQSGSAVRVARILHPQCAPVIFVAPARVEAYSRYSIPGGWHADTHEGVGIFEAAMRHCRRCRDRGPAEFDERLVNVAALSAWGGFAMGCGHANRGVFVAHETYDRFEYTVQYMVTLLRLAASLYGNQPALNRAMGWAPQALFSPCDQCYDKIQAEVVELKLVMHVNDIEGTLPASASFPFASRTHACAPECIF